MIFRIVLICDEEEDFSREITIDADSSFLDLNKAILKACKYNDDQITSFYTCNEDWEQEEQIVREDMGMTASDEDVYIMDKTTLRDFIHDEDQKLIYVFDPFNDRVFYMKVTEIITGKNQKKAECTKSEGNAPKQIKEIDTPVAGHTGNDTLLPGDDNEFFGSDDFDQEDFDPEGFEIEEH